MRPPPGWGGGGGRRRGLGASSLPCTHSHTNPMGFDSSAFSHSGFCPVSLVHLVFDTWGGDKREQIPFRNCNIGKVRDCVPSCGKSAQASLRGGQEHLSGLQPGKQTGAVGSQDSLPRRVCKEGGHSGWTWRWVTEATHSPYMLLSSSHLFKKHHGVVTKPETLVGETQLHIKKPKYPFAVRSCYTAFLTSHCLNSSNNGELTTIPFHFWIALTVRKFFIELKSAFSAAAATRLWGDPCSHSGGAHGVFHGGTFCEFTDQSPMPITDFSRHSCIFQPLRASPSIPA